MTDCMVVGRPNVGKTCFVLNFAEYMGLKKLKLHLRQTAGYTTIKNYKIEDAREELVSDKMNFTDNLQFVKLKIPVGKIEKDVKIIDSCGLKNGIHPDQKIRKAMAATIRNLTNSNLILHIIDVSSIDINDEKLLSPIDKMILNYSSLNNNYAILINKIDIPEYKSNIDIIKNQYSSIYMIAISALYKKGFKEVKKLVLKYV